MSTETKGALQEPRRRFLHFNYLGGSGITIGPKGYENSAEVEIPNAIHVDLDYPGYDGLHLPFKDNSQDFVYSSHVLEHIEHSRAAIKEWFRVIKPGGYLFIVVPHAYLYERASFITHNTLGTAHRSTRNVDHWRAYTPAFLVGSIELAIVPNTWRLRHCADNDYGYDYTIPKDQHPGGRYEIECIVQKINPPSWTIE